ncbi:MAG: outer membrane beta-barrel protein [Myxococcota bacterium]|nr:outer membrane beta-barrel protein [Myxococcota bacterium]
MRPLAAISAGTLAAACAADAGAVEREHHLGADVGAAVLVVHDKSTADAGGGAGAHWTYGLSDAFNLMAEGTWSLVALHETAQSRSTPKTRPASVTNLDLGVGYVFDVLRWVPYAGLLLGSYVFSGGTIQSARILPGAALALGLDYRVDRSWTAGVALRQHVFTDASTYPSYTQVLARFEYTWGW